MDHRESPQGALCWSIGIGATAVLATAISVGATIASFTASHYSEEVLIGFAAGVGFGIIAALLWTAVALIRRKGRHRTAGLLVIIAGVLCLPSGLLLIILGILLRRSKKLAGGVVSPATDTQCQESPNLSANEPRTCPHCGATYRASEYRPEAQEHRCSSCRELLPRPV